MPRTTLHITMYPWFAMGHLTAFLHISNKLAERGHTISFIIPTKTQAKLEHFNLHPHLIRFIPLVVPQVDGLPPGAETTADVPYPLHSLIMTAMDHTKNDIEAMLRDLMPDLIFFDFAYWIPALVRQLSIKSIHYCIISAGSIAYLLVPARKLDNDDQISEANLMQPPLGFPPSSIKFHVHEARSTALFKQKEFGSGISFDKRQMISLKECDAIAIRTCREIEGPYCEYLERQFNKLVLLSGYVVPEMPTSQLEEKWAKWLGEFKIGSVVYCAFGSECTLKKDQFQELLLGFEMTNLPFFAALKPPMGAKSIEEALPKGYLERVEGRGVVHGGWVQQQLVLSHPSVGCFVTHCGSGSLSEALVNECQLVLLPQFGDQFVNARMMGGDLKVGIEVKKGEEDGLFTRESVCNAVKLAMDENDEFAREVRANHTKWKDFLLTEGIESSYTDSFIEKLKGLLV